MRRSAKQFFLLSLAAFTFLIFGSMRPASAELCTVDIVPAATILVPYFEVDLSSCGQAGGTNTYFSILNTTAAPVTAHVVVWTDWSVPLFAFDVELNGGAGPNVGSDVNGFDIEEINLKEVLCEGTVPFPATVHPEPFNEMNLEDYRTLLQGKASPETGLCASAPRSSDTAIGYITIDNVTTMGLGFPSEGDSYFTDVSNENSLTSHVYIDRYETVEETQVELGAGLSKKKCKKKKTDRAKQRCIGQNKLIRKLNKSDQIGQVTTAQVQKSIGVGAYPAVHIEADPTFDSTSTTSGKTFYGRYTTGGMDNREPIGTTFSARFSKTLTPPENWDVIIWKEGDTPPGQVVCGTFPDWYPLNDVQVIAFSDDHDVQELIDSNVSPFELQCVEDFILTIPTASGPLLNPAFYPNGWLYYNLNGLELRQGWLLQKRDGLVDGAGVTPLTTACD